MKSSDIQADSSSEVLLQYALTRRALALDQANLIEFSVSMAWVERIIKMRMEAPPPGYEKPSFKQLMAADVQLFTEMADRTRAGVQPNAAGRPLDKILKDCMYLPEVSLLMQPRPVVKMEYSSNPPSKFSSKGKGSSGGKGKGKGKVKGSAFSKMPQGLVGCYSKTAKGEPICFGFNLGKCTEKVDVFTSVQLQDAVVITRPSHVRSIRTNLNPEVERSNLGCTVSRKMEDSPWLQQDRVVRSQFSRFFTII